VTPIKPKKILIIENDPDILTIVNEVLIEEGYETASTWRTDDIFSTINYYHPDLLLIDYGLNGINGAKICQEIKDNHGTNHLPVIIMSTDERILPSLTAVRCNAFIPKPFDIYDLIEKIDGCLQ
jgi:DNA-binding response OmpR family regulator